MGLGQLRVSEAGSGFEIAQRSFCDPNAAGIANDAGTLAPNPFPSGKGNWTREMKVKS